MKVYYVPPNNMYPLGLVGYFFDSKRITSGYLRNYFMGFYSGDFNHIGTSYVDDPDWNISQL